MIKECAFDAQQLLIAQYWPKILHPCESLIMLHLHYGLKSTYIHHNKGISLLLTGWYFIRACWPSRTSKVSQIIFSIEKAWDEVLCFVTDYLVISNFTDNSVNRNFTYFRWSSKVNTKINSMDLRIISISVISLLLRGKQPSGALRWLQQALSRGHQCLLKLL